MYQKRQEGVFLPSQFEGTFLSTAHTKEDIEKNEYPAFDTALSPIVK